jgi:membrane protein
MATIEAGIESGRGRNAEVPSLLPWRGWKDIFWRIAQEFMADRITLIAAGVTFYLLLALFPALAAFVSLYGFVADPVTIADQIAFLAGVLPSGGVDLIRAQLESLAQQNQAALSFGFVFGLLFALWSANNGIKTLFQAMNVVYEEREKRSFVKLTLVSFLFTLGAIVIGILFIVSVGVVPAVIAFVGLGGWDQTLISLLRWPVLFIVSAMAISTLYRFGPSREYAQWRWLSWGSALATALWLVASVLFSWYLSNFANYNATYGSLGAVIGFMMWTWLSVVILLLGAELNAEMEHQTAFDTTTGTPKPMGDRGATMADTLGRSRAAGLADAPDAFDPSRRLSRNPEELKPRNGKRRDMGDRLGTLLGYALPVSVLAGLAVAEVLDRRKPHAADAAPKQPAQPKARSATRMERATAAAAPWVRRGRNFMESPAGRAFLERALRPAPGKRR